MTKQKVRTIVVSDVHLGAAESKAEFLISFLKTYSCDYLYLVGDIIDGWKIKSNSFIWKESYSELLHLIFEIANSGTTVKYIVGNHDEFLRPFLHPSLIIKNIEIVNHCRHCGINGKEFIVVHGDMFDGISTIAPWLAYLGDKLYSAALIVNSYYNNMRHSAGLGYWSISKYMKHRVKGAVNFLFQFEQNITNHAKKFNVDGIICGHIHHLDLKTVNGVIYLNSGDWVESCSALVELETGEWNGVILDEKNEMSVVAKY